MSDRDARTTSRVTTMIVLVVVVLLPFILCGVGTFLYATFHGGDADPAGRHR